MRRQPHDNVFEIALIKKLLVVIFSFLLCIFDYRSFLRRVGHCISKKPLNKDYLYEGVSQLYLNKPGNA